MNDFEFVGVWTTILVKFFIFNLVFSFIYFWCTQFKYILFYAMKDF